MGRSWWGDNRIFKALVILCKLRFLTPVIRISDTFHHARTQPGPAPHAGVHRRPWHLFCGGQGLTPRPADRQPARERVGVAPRCQSGGAPQPQRHVDCRRRHPRRSRPSPVARRRRGSRRSSAPSRRQARSRAAGGFDRGRDRFAAAGVAGVAGEPSRHRCGGQHPELCRSHGAPGPRHPGTDSSALSCTWRM